MDRFSGNCDPLTGDFSGVAKSSKLFVNGENRGPVVETMIAGNVFDLSNNIVAVGDRVETVSGQILCPTIVADGVTVST